MTIHGTLQSLELVNPPFLLLDLLLPWPLLILRPSTTLKLPPFDFQHPLKLTPRPLPLLDPPTHTSWPLPPPAEFYVQFW